MGPEKGYDLDGLNREVVNDDIDAAREIIEGHEPNANDKVTLTEPELDEFTAHAKRILDIAIQDPEFAAKIEARKRELGPDKKADGGSPERPNPELN